MINQQLSLPLDSSHWLAMTHGKEIAQTRRSDRG
jgi:hypothetical protein